jgi:hypothetical protein
MLDKICNNKAYGGAVGLLEVPSAVPWAPVTVSAVPGAGLQTMPLQLPLNESINLLENPYPALNRT